MKNKTRVSTYVWAIVYALLGLLLAFLIVWNISLAFGWEWAIELRSSFNTDIRNTQYFASSSLLLQAIIIVVALILIACLIINDNHAKRIEKMKRKLTKANSIIEESKNTINE